MSFNPSPVAPPGIFVLGAPVRERRVGRRQFEILLAVREALAEERSRYQGEASPKVAIDHPSGSPR